MTVIATRGGEGVELAELFTDSSAAGFSEANDGLIWKTILRTGRWELSPDITGQPKHEPIVVVRDNAGEGEIALSDLVNAFEDGAIDQVTVPLSHADRADENTGYVRKMRITGPDSQGIHRLQAGFDFTEPDIKQRVLNASVPGNSVGMVFDYQRKSDAKKYPAAVAHVALTSKPWISGLEPFGVLAASQDIDFERAYGLQLAEDQAVAPDPNEVAEAALRDAVASELDRIRAGIQDQLGEGFAIDELNVGSVIVKAGDGKRFLVPYYISGVRNEDGSMTDPMISIAERETWKEIKAEEPAPAPEPAPEPILASELHRPASASGQRLSLAEAQEMRRRRRASADSGRGNEHIISRGGEHVSDSTKSGGELQLSEEQMTARIQELEAENKRYADETRKGKVEERVDELKEMGLEEHPGLLKEIRNIYLSDDGQPALMLSEDENGSQRSELTATEIVDRVVAALPKTEDGKKLALSEQAVVSDTGDTGRPDADARNEKSPEEVADEVAKELGLPARKEVTV